MAQVLKEPKHEEGDTLPILEGVAVPSKIDGSIDFIGHELNFLEDFLGRFNKTIPFDNAVIEVAVKLFRYSKMDKNAFVKEGKEHIGTKSDLFDRFLNYLWSKYISQIDRELRVLDIEKAKEIFNNVYRLMMYDFENISTNRFIRNWPYPIPDDEQLDDF